MALLIPCTVLPVLKQGISSPPWGRFAEYLLPATRHCITPLLLKNTFFRRCLTTASSLVTATASSSCFSCNVCSTCCNHHSTERSSCNSCCACCNHPAERIAINTIAWLTLTCRFFTNWSVPYVLVGMISTNTTLSQSSQCSCVDARYSMWCACMRVGSLQKVFKYFVCRWVFTLQILVYLLYSMNNVYVYYYCSQVSCGLD